MPSQSRVDISWDCQNFEFIIDFSPLKSNDVEDDIRRTIHKHLEMVQKDTFKVPSGPLIGLPLGAEGLGVFGDGACQLPSDYLIIVKIRRQATAHALHSVQRKATVYEKTYPSWWALSMYSKRID